MKSPKSLSRRERQIMDIIYNKGSATAAQVLESMPNPPSYSTVRALLRILEEKGHLKHKSEGTRYVFIPTVPKDEAVKNAFKHLLTTFFDGSPEKAVATLLDISESELSDEDYEKMTLLIEKARIEGR